MRSPFSSHVIHLITDIDEAQLARPSGDSSSPKLSVINHLSFFFSSKISVPSDPLNLGWNVAVCAERTALKGV